MALFDDIADDYTIMDGIENVTLTPQNRTPPIAAIPNIKALRQPVTLRMMQTAAPDLKLKTTDINFELWEASMATVPAEIKEDDKLTDAAAVHYRILGASRDHATSRWSIFARKHA